MTRLDREPWAERAPVEPVTHAAQPSGLLEAWQAVPVACCSDVCARNASGGVVDRSQPCAVCGWAPTADDVSAWMDEDEPQAQEVG